MSLAGEVRALRSSAGLTRASHVAVVHVEGPGALDLLQHACTQSPYLREGRVLHTLLLRPDGSVFADACVTAVDDGYFVLAEGPGEEALVTWLDGLKARDGGARSAEVRGRSAEWAVLGIDGPYAWEVATGLLGPGVLGMPYLSLLRRDEVLCLRAGKTGEYGYALLVPRASATAVEEKLAAIGRPLDLASVGSEALDVCALENAHFSVRTLRGSALAGSLTPIELQIQWRVVYAREFVGAEALRLRRAEGPRMRATCITADGPIAPGHAVHVAGREAGAVLASCLSPTLGRWIGSALLDVRVAHPHVVLAAKTETGAVPVETCTAPLVDNLSLRIDPHKHTYATRDAPATSGEPVR
ncbi:MAG: glycine cleavage T C-terminal barrel domain-containing protein [Polyangiaceae bacterium]